MYNLHNRHVCCAYDLDTGKAKASVGHMLVMHYQSNDLVFTQPQCEE